MRLESGDLQQKLSETEELLSARDRELAEALEQVQNLSDELVIKQGKVSCQLLVGSLLGAFVLRCVGGVVLG